MENKVITREFLLKEVLEQKDKKNYVLELPTGFGKTKIALSLASEILSSLPKGIPHKILIVSPRLSIIESWKEEIKKWDFDIPVEFTTYKSVVKVKKFPTMVIWEEAHHISERVSDWFREHTPLYNIFLSATLPRDWNQRIWLPPQNTYYKKVTALEVTPTVLPDPKVILYPLTLDNEEVIANYVYKGYFNDTVKCPYDQRAEFLRNPKYKGKAISVECTAKQYIELISQEISYLKSVPTTKNTKRMLILSGKLLKFLAHLKGDFPKIIRGRKITFCGSIEQAEAVSRNPVSSRTKDSMITLEKFNKGEINHISCCNMLDEGVNLNECKTGIFLMINSSVRLSVQRIGRILRHEFPCLVFPYFKGTREEEILKTIILPMFNSNNVITHDT